MKTRVLFVDDERDVLTGIRRMLRRFRSQWTMAFAESGEEALKLMAESPIDVIVTDMRMPGMNGEQLLAEVKKRFPGTVRIVLSGYADRASIMRSVGLVHQYLAKPCDPDRLIAMVQRACSLQNVISQESLKQVIAQVSTLPSPSGVYQELLTELQSPDASIRRVGQLISEDVGMTAKLLQIVNSSFFGIPRRIETPSHAATLLGLDTLRPLVLSAGIFSQFVASDIDGYSVDRMLDHCHLVARNAHQIAVAYGKDSESAQAAMLAGMLHDVGHLLFMAYMPVPFGESLALARADQIPLWRAEISVFGASHFDVGAYLLSLWGFPSSVVEAVAFHRQPAKHMSNSFAPLTAVHVAHSLAEGLTDAIGIPSGNDVDVEYLEHIGVYECLPEWRRIVTNCATLSV